MQVINWKVRFISSIFYLCLGIDTPAPVFFCTAEPPNLASMNNLQKALTELSIEDPSLKIREDQELAQTVIEGMVSMENLLNAPYRENSTSKLSKKDLNESMG